MKKKTSRSATAHTGGSAHYQSLDVQPWDVMETCFSPDEFKGFLKGCALKRIMRANTKGVELEDLIKAHHELGHAIAILKQREN